MTILIITLCGIAFIAILVLNIYFRVKVLRNYRELARNKVQFGAEHFFNKKKLEEEILPRYPQQREAILTFVNNIRFSVLCASALVVVISILAASLMFFN